MSDDHREHPLIDLPNPGKIEEHGVTIDAPTPTHAIADPWAPHSGNGSAPAPPQPAASASDDE
jgi:hypothetical protein